jgi:hypothetical protein
MVIRCPALGGSSGGSHLLDSLHPPHPTVSHHCSLFPSSTNSTTYSPGHSHSRATTTCAISISFSPRWYYCLALCSGRRHWREAGSTAENRRWKPQHLAGCNLTSHHHSYPSCCRIRLIKGHYDRAWISKGNTSESCQTSQNLAWSPVRPPQH